MQLPELACRYLTLKFWLEDLTPPFVQLETWAYTVLVARIKARFQKCVLPKLGIGLLSIST